MSQDFELDVPDSLENESPYLNVPGIFHLVVNDVMVGTGPKGAAIDGFTVAIEVRDGTVRDKNGCTEVSKMINLSFFRPGLNDKDGGQFARLRMSRFFLAVNAIDPMQAGKPAKVDMERIKGQNFVARFEHNTNDGKTFLRVAGADTWHIDDPHAKSCPKEQASLKLIPAELRHTEDWFEKYVYKKEQKKQSSASPSASQATAPAREAVTSADDL